MAEPRGDRVPTVRRTLACMTNPADRREIPTPIGRRENPVDARSVAEGETVDPATALCSHAEALAR